jgi:hypothetical protein
MGEPQMNDTAKLQNSQSDIEKEMVLVGFGKHDLTDMIKWIGTDREMELLIAPSKWPPRWRRMGICEDADLQAMKAYIEFTTERLNDSVIGGL